MQSSCKAAARCSLCASWGRLELKSRRRRRGCSICAFSEHFGGTGGAACHCQGGEGHASSGEAQTFAKKQRRQGPDAARAENRRAPCHGGEATHSQAQSGCRGCSRGRCSPRRIPLRPREAEVRNLLHREHRDWNAASICFKAFKTSPDRNACFVDDSPTCSPQEVMRTFEEAKGAAGTVRAISFRAGCPSDSRSSKGQPALLGVSCTSTKALRDARRLAAPPLTHTLLPSPQASVVAYLRALVSTGAISRFAEPSSQEALPALLVEMRQRLAKGRRGPIGLGSDPSRALHVVVSDPRSLRAGGGAFRWVKDVLTSLFVLTARFRPSQRASFDPSLSALLLRSVLCDRAAVGIPLLRATCSAAVH